MRERERGGGGEKVVLGDWWLTSIEGWIQNIQNKKSSSSFLDRPLYCLTFFPLLRWQHEAELKLIEEETSKRVEEAIQRKVEESLNSEEIKVEIQTRMEEGRKKLLNEVAAQLEKEKEAAIIEARQKEVNDYANLCPSFF